MIQLIQLLNLIAYLMGVKNGGESCGVGCFNDFEKV